ncbi:Protein of unknown function DUF761 [Macleaya cordata]|uniref:DUF761 domain-containing protein n=1 Tax=Macleaya cordata TaxID=56857 RepID=A0A200QH36_MACCD|nr:Protein of unknown function DUF761 [Macleaya cordata]
MSKRKHHYFPCINPTPVEDPEEIIEESAKAVVVVPNKIGYSPDEYSYNFRFGTPDLAPGDNLSPLAVAVSPFSKIRVSNYSSEDEENDGSHQEVDNEAEEFIRRFYEQLRLQSRTQLLQYQETQYQEMLARGTG